MPTSLDGIEKYLGSGMIRGIGPVYAKKLVRAFGEKVFDTIEAEPEHLREVMGIIEKLRYLFEEEIRLNGEIVDESAIVAAVITHFEGNVA